MAFSITSLYDQQSLTQPLRFGENAVAEGVFSEQQGRVLVGDVEATVQTWTASQIVFVPNGDSRPEGNYAVHVDNIPGVTGPSEYLIDFTTKSLGAWTHTRASDATAPNESGTIITYTTDQPAWYRDQGLQLEDESTNYCADKVMNSSYWGRFNGATITQHISVLDPMGNSAFDVTSNGGQAQTQNPIDPPPTGNSRSMYYRSVSGTGTVQAFRHNSEPNLISLTDTFERFDSISDFAHIGGNLIYVIDDRGTPGSLGRCFTAMPQSEESAFPTSYIATVGTPVTRAATSCTATFAELGSPLPAGGMLNNYSFQIKLRLLCDWDSISDELGLFQLYGSGAWSQNCSIHRHISGDVRAYLLLSAGAQSIRVPQSSPVTGDLLDIRFAKRDNSSYTSGHAMRLWVNGVGGGLGGATPESDMDRALTEAHIMSSIIAAGHFTVEKVRIVPEALTDEEIEAWT